MRISGTSAAVALLQALVSRDCGRGGCRDVLRGALVGTRHAQVAGTVEAHEEAIDLEKLRTVVEGLFACVTGLQPTRRDPATLRGWTSWPCAGREPRCSAVRHRLVHWRVPFEDRRAGESSC